MTNNTINVPRELLENIVLCYNEGEFELGTLAAECHALLSATSPAGVDGLEVYITDCATCVDVVPAKTVTDAKVVLAKDAKAIIDGLRGEVAEQEETVTQWRELALQFDRHRMTAMAHIRAAASGDKSAIEALGVFAALPPIPGHEITAERDQQAQRIGELAELAAQANVNCKNTAYYLRRYRPDLADICSGWCVAIDAALSSGKKGE